MTDLITLDNFFEALTVIFLIVLAYWAFKKDNRNLEQIRDDMKIKDDEEWRWRYAYFSELPQVVEFLNWLEEEGGNPNDAKVMYNNGYVVVYSGEKRK